MFALGRDEGKQNIPYADPWRAPFPYYREKDRGRKANENQAPLSISFHYPVAELRTEN
jgi:hypothetical protein